MMNNAPDRQTPANKNMPLWNPIDAVKSGKNFNVKNWNIHNSVMQNDVPKLFNLSGITSEKE